MATDPYSEFIEPKEDQPGIKQFKQRWGQMIVDEAIHQGAMGGGAYSYPAILDRYERALGLKPAEAWLLKRLLTFDWEGKGYVFCSLRKISEEADVSYGEVLKLARSLEHKGYIRDMGQHGNNAFNQVRDWSIRGLLRALEYTILCDPNTKHGKAKAEQLGHPVTMADFWNHADGPKKGQPFTPYLGLTTPKQVNEWCLKGDRIPGWDPFYGGSVDIPQPAKREQRQATCPDCGTFFATASRNPATRCKKCRKARKRLSLKPLVTA